MVLLFCLMWWYLPGTHAMVMFSSVKNVRCCFRRLGIMHASSDRQQIEQAFRRLAFETHPKKFTNPPDKERTTFAFRELYETYQETLTAESSGSAAAEQNRNARTITDSDVRKAFQDTCDELDRIMDAKLRKSCNQLTGSVQEAWPDRDLTWKILRMGCLLSPEIDMLVSFFEGGSYADNSPFLREKLAQRTLERHNKYLEYDQWARYIEDQWPDPDTDTDAEADANITLLKEWAKTTWWLLEYGAVADRVRVKIPLAATTIMDWGAEIRASVCYCGRGCQHQHY
jgi:hypothetical protein